MRTKRGTEQMRTGIGRKTFCSGSEKDSSYNKRTKQMRTRKRTKIGRETFRLGSGKDLSERKRTNNGEDFLLGE
jgi:hypothetical protein